MDRLHAALTEGKDLEPFLRVTVPATLLDADVEGVSLHGLKFAMEQLGYTRDFDIPMKIATERTLRVSSAAAFRLPRSRQS